MDGNDGVMGLELELELEFVWDWVLIRMACFCGELETGNGISDGLVFSTK